MAEPSSIDQSLVAGLDDVVPLRLGEASTVFGATANGRRVAVKVVSIRSAVDRARFEREVEAIRRLRSCSEVPELVDVRTTDDTAALVMALGPGSDLGTVLATGGSFGWTAVVDFGVRFAETVHHAHVVGVVHGDIKPANVLVSVDVRPTLIDFGSARLSLDATERLGVDDIVYTPGFSAPEIYDGVAPTRAADVFSVGATLWAMATGTAPFGAATDPVPEVIGRTIAGSPGALPQGTPSALGALIASMLSVSPGLRPASMGDVASSLRRLQAR